MWIEDGWCWNNSGNFPTQSPQKTTVTHPMTEFVKLLTTFFVVSHKENFCYDRWHAAMISQPNILEMPWSYRFTSWRLFGKSSSLFRVINTNTYILKQKCPNIFGSQNAPEVFFNLSQHLASKALCFSKWNCLRFSVWKGEDIGFVNPAHNWNQLLRVQRYEY